MSEITTAFPPRSAHVETRGVVFFARQLDKIRLHAAGKLPSDYNLGFNRDDTFDARFCRFWGVDFDALTALTLQGGTDEEIFDAIFADRLPLNEEQVRAWNGFCASAACVTNVPPRLPNSKPRAAGPTATTSRRIWIFKTWTRAASRGRAEPDHGEPLNSTMLMPDREPDALEKGIRFGCGVMAVVPIALYGAWDMMVVVHL